MMMQPAPLILKTWPYLAPWLLKAWPLIVCPLLRKQAPQRPRNAPNVPAVLLHPFRVPQPWPWLLLIV
jgi:hypothetical protein